MSTRSDSLAPPATGDIVLVHGGWHGGWVWEHLAPMLAAAGHRVHTPTLTGLGDRAPEFNAEVGLQTHVDDVAQCVVGQNLSQIALVGHSYGGSIITAVADRMPERVSTLIYLDAIVPSDGVPDWYGFPSERRAAMLAGAQRLDGLRVPPPDPAVWGLVPETAVYRQIRERLTPHPLKTMTDAPRLSGRWQTVRRKYYLLAAGPPVSRFASVHARLSTTPGWTTALVTGCHEMMWTHPNELAATLLPLVAGGTVLPIAEQDP